MSPTVWIGLLELTQEHREPVGLDLLGTQQAVTDQNLSQLHT